MFIDVVLLILLCVTLFFAIRLSRQFADIRRDQDKLSELVMNLNTASERAEKAVKSMRKNALETSEKLQGDIIKAQGLSDELDIMIEAGNSLAERLQKIAEKSRKATQGNDTKKPKAANKKSASKKKKEPRSRAEKELIEALKAQGDI